jgi:hypothetical protein
LTTLTEKDYGFSFYTETSGAWVAPERCHKALIIFAGGGGGGGGGAGGGVAPQPASGAGGLGGNGGDTIVIGSFGEISCAGGAGGLGGNPVPSPSAGPGGAGQGGSHSGRSGRGSPARNALGNQITVTTINNIGYYSGLPEEINSCDGLAKRAPFGGAMGALNTHKGNIGDTLSFDPAAATNNVNSFTLLTEKGNNSLNSGSGGATGSNGGSPAGGTTIGGGGGGGGNSYGVKKLVNIAAGESISITIGSGGDGGNGGNGTSSAVPSQAGGVGGKGGASGFTAIYWNED